MPKSASDTSQRSQLLETAKAEFAQHGFEATSMQNVATAAGVSKAKVFYYFNGKDALYAEVLEQALAPLLCSLEDAQPVADTEAFWQSLRTGLDFAIEFAARDSHAAALLRDFYRRGGNALTLQALLDRVHAAVCRWLLNGQRLGAVRSDLALPLLAEAVVGALVQIDRRLASVANHEQTAEVEISSRALAAFVEDALKLRLPPESEVALQFAAEEAPRKTDAYLGEPATMVQVFSVRNGRETQPAPCFEQQGFELTRAPVAFTQPPSETEARACYGLIEEALKDRLGAALAKVFDHTVRHTERTPGQRPPIRFVHADYGQNAGFKRFREVLGQTEVERWSGSRVMVANLWQSVAGVVHSTPLAFADIGSVSSDDFVPVTIEYPDRTGEIGYYRPNQDQQWYWFPFLRAEEALLFKTFDGQPGDRHWTCPHTAFDAPSSPEALSGQRTSIEFRILLVFADSSPASQ